MPELVNGNPSPSSHIKTLMRIGYDLNSAVADIIDNSITSEATTISITCPPGLKEPVILISDNGCGMAEADLLQNMRIGCKDPSQEREVKDLGRFGSGMKTASFSQARKLIVISKEINSEVCGAYWDIDEIEETDTWCLKKLSHEEIHEIPHLNLDIIKGSGTQLIWEKIPKFFIKDHTSLESEIASSMVELSKYIALHFHKFMQGTNKVSISVQNRELIPLDPFLKGVDGSQDGPSEPIRTKKGKVTVNTHILPHPERIPKHIVKAHGGIDEIYKNQGLYIYRANRLIIAGGWMGISNTNILGNLARVEINIPASLDDEWSTDVKKSSMQLPSKVKAVLKRLGRVPVERSKKEHTYKGKVEIANQYWEIVEDEIEKTIKYHVALDNGELNNLAEDLSKDKKTSLKKFLQNLSKNLPYHNIFQKHAENPRAIKQDDLDLDALIDISAELDKLWNT
tara:strand:- start:6037 stop:7401 length:1365 start_codon:yes stop_codon:yes gene_type:complete